MKVLRSLDVDPDELRTTISENQPKLMYTVPNFQNPAGISYSEKNRVDIASLLEDTDIFLIEDNPYGDLRFSGNEKPTTSKYREFWTRV